MVVCLKLGHLQKNIQNYIYGPKTNNMHVKEISGVALSQCI